jgi:hypothetical protein
MTGPACSTCLATGRSGDERYNTDPDGGPFKDWAPAAVPEMRAGLG